MTGIWLMAIGVMVLAAIGAYIVARRLDGDL